MKSIDVKLSFSLMDSGILHWLQNKSKCISLGENIPTFHLMYYSENMGSIQSSTQDNTTLQVTVPITVELTAAYALG